MPGSRLGKGAHDPGVTPLSEADRVLGQIQRGEIDASPDAARKIAREIEDQGGFWGPRTEAPSYRDQQWQTAIDALGDET